MHRGGYNEFQQMYSKWPEYTCKSQSCFDEKHKQNIRNTTD